MSQQREFSIPGSSEPRRGHLSLVEKPASNLVEKPDANPVGRAGMTILIRARNAYPLSDMVTAAEAALLSGDYRNSAVRKNPKAPSYPLEDLKDALINDTELIAEATNHLSVTVPERKASTGAYWTTEGQKVTRAEGEDEVRKLAMNIFTLAQRLADLPRASLVKIVSMYQADLNGRVNEASIRRAVNLMLAGAAQTENDPPPAKRLLKLVPKLGASPVRPEDRCELDLARGFADQIEGSGGQESGKGLREQPKVLFMANRRRKVPGKDNFGNGPHAA